MRREYPFAHAPCVRWNGNGRPHGTEIASNGPSADPRSLPSLDVGHFEAKMARLCRPLEFSRPVEGGIHPQGWRMVLAFDSVDTKG